MKKKVNLGNLKGQEISSKRAKSIITGGGSCSAYYCANVNPNANCCSGGSQTCPPYYCTFVNPAADCCN